MAKKTFPTRSRVVDSRPNWYIEYYQIDPETGEISRHRQDFDLNKIADLAVRREVADRIAANIDLFAKAPKDRSAAKSSGISDEVKTCGLSVAQAVEKMRDLKIGQSDVTSTKNDFRAAAKDFLTWAKRAHYSDMSIEKFTRAHAAGFWDYLATRAKRGGGLLSGVSRNNRFAMVRAIFGAMVERGLFKENPLGRFRRAKVTEKERRIFTVEERRVVALEAEKTDYWLFRGILLQYYCFIRPVELLRLKMGDFDFKAGTVRVKVKKGRTVRYRYATIPRSVMKYFVDGRFEKYSAGLLVFGITEESPYQFKIGPSNRPGDDDLLYRRHRRILERLRERGELRNINGLTWYSWKDTGISAHAPKTQHLSTRDQAGHSSFQTTLRYYTAPKVIEEYAAIQHDLFT